MPKGATSQQALRRQVLTQHHGSQGCLLVCQRREARAEHTNSRTCAPRVSRDLIRRVDVPDCGGCHDHLEDKRPRIGQDLAGDGVELGELPSAFFRPPPAHLHQRVRMIEPRDAPPGIEAENGRTDGRGQVGDAVVGVEVGYVVPCFLALVPDLLYLGGRLRAREPPPARVSEPRELVGRDALAGAAVSVCEQCLEALLCAFLGYGCLLPRVVVLDGRGVVGQVDEEAAEEKVGRFHHQPPHTPTVPIPSSPEPAEEREQHRCEHDPDAEEREGKVPTSGGEEIDLGARQ